VLKSLTKIITGLIFLLHFAGFAQGEFNNWYFGDAAGITFNSGPPTNGGTDPVFQWKVNGNTMLVYPDLTADVVVIPSENPVCEWMSVNCIATAINGGSTPSFQWHRNLTGRACSPTGQTTLLPGRH
jgi:hypothetical protein